MKVKIVMFEKKNKLFIKQIGEKVIKKKYLKIDSNTLIFPANRRMWYELFLDVSFYLQKGMVAVGYMLLKDYEKIKGGSKK